MSRWTWEDTLWVVAITAVLAMLIGAVAQQAALQPVVAVHRIAVPLDTVPCGGLARCEERERARWMSTNPFAAPGRTETR
jgi:hypothetical protein